MDRFYEDIDSLFVRAYDAFYVSGAPIAGDIAFYERLARETGGRVLELACGTARITLALAEKGLEITGVDISKGMLTVARYKAAGRPASVRDRQTLIHQDMSELSLGGRFGLVFVPARSFQHLLTIELQKKSLEAIHRHLEPAGRLALHVFDPRLDLLIDSNTTVPAFWAPILRPGFAMWVRFSEAISTTSIKFGVTSGDIRKSDPMARFFLKRIARWPSAGHIAGNCITFSDSVA